MIPMVSTASPRRSGSILETMYSAPAIRAREAAMLRIDLVMSFFCLKELSVSVIPSEISSIPPQIFFLMSIRLPMNFLIFSRIPPPSSAPMITAMSAPSILVAKFFTLSMMLEKKVLMLFRMSLLSKNWLIFSPIPEKLVNQDFKLPTIPAGPLLNSSLTVVMNCFTPSIIFLMNATTFSTTF